MEIHARQPLATGCLRKSANEHHTLGTLVQNQTDQEFQLFSSCLRVGSLLPKEKLQACCLFLTGAGFVCFCKVLSQNMLRRSPAIGSRFLRTVPIEALLDGRDPSGTIHDDLGAGFAG